MGLTDWDSDHRYALYQSFSVGNTSTKYELHVTGYSGTAGKPCTFVVCIDVIDGIIIVNLAKRGLNMISRYFKIVSSQNHKLKLNLFYCSNKKMDHTQVCST